MVRHQDGTTPIETGDAFIFAPNEPHQLTNNGAEDLVVLVIADNPIGESAYFPESEKWLVRSPERRLVRSESLDYFDGEEFRNWASGLLKVVLAGFAIRRVAAAIAPGRMNIHNSR